MIDINFLEKNIDITSFSNFKTKAIAKYYFEIKNEEDLAKLTIINDYCKKNDLQMLFIWWWTNLLFAFDIFEWVIIKNSLNWWNYNKENQELTTYSNEVMSDLAKNLEEKFGESIWHRFIWLPWTVGWAICWNAWCFWLEAESNFKEALLYNLETWQTEKYNKNKMCFTYRSSFVKDNNNYFIIKSTFDLSKKIEKYNSDVDNIDFRENKQPKWSTCWSFFKNPNRENSAWWLIEEVWLKWFKIWSAFFSPLHANFLINSWNWTYKDLIELINLAQNKVKLDKWYDLIPEVRIIYNK